MNLSAPVPAASSAADDTTLIARYVGGDDQAFAALLTRYQGRVFTSLLFLVRDRTLAEDLLQDTFVKAVELLRTGRYQDQGKFGAWICCIAHNLAVDSLRRSNNKPVVALDVPQLREAVEKARLKAGAESVAASQETTLIQKERNDFLERLIDTLPVDQRQVLLMRHYREMSFPQIASELGVPVSTALGRMRYALRSLRRQIQTTSGGTSLLLSLVLATVATPEMTTAVTATGPLGANFFSSSFPIPHCDDPTFYPGNADPLRLQRPA